MSRHREKRKPGIDLCGTPISSQQNGKDTKMSKKVYFHKIEMREFQEK